jgi:non-homologous end joining protein Ku
LLKAKTLEDGSLAFVSKEELEAARASDLPLNHFRATVHPVDQVADATFDSDNAYVFVPRNYDEYHALLVRLVDESGFAFIAMTNLRNREGFYRLAKWQDHLVVQRLYWPDECNEFEAPEIGCDNATFNAATGMIQRIAQPFDADAYRSSVKERMLELAATLDPDAPRPEVSEQRPAPAPTEDLQAILNAFGPEPSTPQRASA